VAVVIIPSQVTVIVTVPLLPAATPLTVTEEPVVGVTMAMVWSLEIHVIVRPVRGLPPASNACAVKVTVWVPAMAAVPGVT